MINITIRTTVAADNPKMVAADDAEVPEVVANLAPVDTAEEAAEVVWLIAELKNPPLIAVEPGPAVIILA